MNDLSPVAKRLHVSEGKVRGAVDALPIAIGEKLGCGMLGCTYAGAVDGTVVKLTSDDSEVSLWIKILELDESGADVFAGIPEIFGIGELEGIDNGFWISREAVEPLVKGEERALSARTEEYLFGEVLTNQKIHLTNEDWSIENAIKRSKSIGRIPPGALERARVLDEDLYKLYVLTDITQFAEKQPSISEKVWIESYIETAMSLRGPLKGIGESIATILAETGVTWTTDIHLGNVGWRMRGEKPQLVVYDWMTVDLIPNGRVEFPRGNIA